MWLAAICWLLWASEALQQNSPQVLGQAVAQSAAATQVLRLNCLYSWMLLHLTAGSMAKACYGVPCVTRLMYRSQIGFLE